CGYTGDPFIWDETRRSVIRAELDAAFFHLYGISEADADYILETFPIVKAKDEERFGAYRTKELILAAYRRMAAGEAVSDLESLGVSQPQPTPATATPRIQVNTKPINTDLVAQAFLQTRENRSADYVIANPKANERFIQQLESLCGGQVAIRL